MTWSPHRLVVALVVATLAALLAGALARPHPAARHVLLVIDASGSMYMRLDDGQYRITAAKDALRELVTRLPDDGDLDVGLRVYGAQRDALAPDACLDSELVVPVEGFDREALLRSIDDVRALGATPIAYSLELALDDLADVAGPALIVLVTDGAESCGGDVRAAVEGLRDAGIDVDLHIVGVALTPPAAASFEGLGTFESVDRARDLADVLARTLEVDDDARYQVRVTLTRDGERVRSGVTLRLVDAIDASVTELTPTAEGDFAARVGPGTYRAVVDDAAGDVQHLRSGLAVAASDDNTYTIELAPERSVALSVEPDEPRAGTVVTVTYTDAPPEGRGWLTVVAVDAPEHVQAERVAVSGAAGEAPVRVPLEAAELEARYVRAVPGGGATVIGRSAPFTSLPLAARIDAPDAVPAGEPFEVSWDGPGLDGDYLEVVPEGARDGTFHMAPSASAREGSPLTLQAPSEPGGYEVRYVLWEGRRALAAAPLEVTEPEGRLDAPAEVAAGAAFEVHWSGPGHDGDALTIVPAGARDGTVHGTSRASATDGSPATLQAPPVPGDHEVRYVLHDGRRTLLAVPIVVGPPDATIEVASVLAAGEPFEVAWTGPANERDYLMIVPAGARDGRFHMVSTARTRDGSPLTLVAPDEPGAYEVRYVLDQGRLTLIAVGVEVR